MPQAIARGEAEAEKRDPELQKAGVAKRRASRGALPRITCRDLQAQRRQSEAYIANVLTRLVNGGRITALTNSCPGSGRPPTPTDPIKKQQGRQSTAYFESAGLRWLADKAMAEEGHHTLRGLLSSEGGGNTQPGPAAPQGVKA